MSVENCDLSKLPFVFIGNPKQLPASPGVYFACTDDLRVKYVGMSENLRQRHQNHDRQQDFHAEKVQKICYIATTQDLLGLEDRYIKHFNPVLNRKGKVSQEIVDNSEYSSKVPDNPEQFLNWYANVCRQEVQVKEDKEQYKERAITLVDELGSVKSGNTCKSYNVQPCGSLRIQSLGETIYTDEVQALEKDLKNIQNLVLGWKQNQSRILEEINKPKTLAQEEKDLLIQRRKIDDALKFNRQLQEQYKLKEACDHCDDQTNLLDVEELIIEAEMKRDLAKGKLETRKQYEDENGLSHSRKKIVFLKK